VGRVARWFIFKPKILIWVNFGRSCNGKCWFTVCPFGECSSHLVNAPAIWYNLWAFGIFYGRLVYFPHFGIFFTVLVCCTNKNLATGACQNNKYVI
jgi:hypothetical protein